MERPMDPQALRHVIRGLVAEELRAQRGTRAPRAAPPPAVRAETVALGNDGELARFVRRLMDLAADGSSRAEILSGQRVFRLQEPSARQAEPAPAAAEASFERGLVSERHLADLPAGSVVRMGRCARITPLACDEARRRNITIERGPA